MSIQPFESGDIEVFTIQTAPKTTFISSSITGVTGSAYVYPRRSNAIKDFYINWTAESGAPDNAYTQINDVGEILKKAKLAQTSAEKLQYMQEYLGVVGNQPQSLRNVQKQEIIRTVPGINLDLNMTKKFVTTNVLMPYYSSFGTNYDFSYTNYHSLNFLSASGLPTASALIYPTSASSAGVGQLVSASYIPSGAFSFDFWINPRYTSDSAASVFKAGTILHLSSAYALSLITGSSRDSNGLPDKYRLLLQLSNSCDVSPSSINVSSLSGLTFVSNDNCIDINTWNHVTIRWGTNSYNFGSGSFMVNETESGIFYIPSASIAPQDNGGVFSNTLVVGNYYEGNNSSTSETSYFFSTAAKKRYGIPVGVSLNSSTTQDQPAVYSLNHPLQAEVHELKIYNKYLSREEISSRRTTGAPLTSDLLFYLPPLFTKESPTRSVDLNGSVGGILASPFLAINGTTNQPFNVDLSFDSGAHYINLENFTRDFSTGNYPRLIQLTGSVIANNQQQLTANEFLYATGSNKKASLTVLPNDNGYFVPNYFELLGNLDNSSFVTDKGNLAYNLISLRNMYPLTSIYDLVPPNNGSLLLNTATSGSIISTLSGFDSTSSLGVLNHQKTPSILQRTQENGSLQVVMFDISNLFYGNKIKQGTFVITDNDLSNSSGKMSITLKDDGYGSLYRADAVSSLAVGNSVGNIFYDNGIVIINNPSLYFFGKNGFECSFTGERNIHVQKMDLYANPLELVSSSNPGWSPALSASNATDDFDKRYVYITDIYIHDENLNVLARTKLSSPVLKRSGDKLKFTVKLDYFSKKRFSYLK
jgi:hypothetical protein